MRAQIGSPTARNLAAILKRLKFVRDIGIGAELADRVHPHRFRQLARESAVAPSFLLSDYSLRRRRATISARLIDLEQSLPDAAVTMFNKQTASLFARAMVRQRRGYAAKAGDVGRLMRAFGATIGAIADAREEGGDVLAAVEERVGIATLLSLRPQVDEIAGLADEDLLVRAADKYMTLRRYAPAFLDAFTFRASRREPALAAVETLRELNQSGRKQVPPDAPMPFSAKWKKLIKRADGTIDRRLYETAAVATVRDRLNSGDVWIEGTRNYRPFDEYLLPRAEVPAVAANSGCRQARPTTSPGDPSYSTGGCGASRARSGAERWKA